MGKQTNLECNLKAVGALVDWWDALIFGQNQHPSRVSLLDAFAMNDRTQTQRECNEQRGRFRDVLKQAIIGELRAHNGFCKVESNFLALQNPVFMALNSVSLSHMAPRSCITYIQEDGRILVPDIQDPCRYVSLAYEGSPNLPYFAAYDFEGGNYYRHSQSGVVYKGAPSLCDCNIGYGFNYQAVGKGCILLEGGSGIPTEVMDGVGWTLEHNGPE